MGHTLRKDPSNVIRKPWTGTHKGRGNKDAQANMEAEHHGRVKEDWSDMGNSEETRQGLWKVEAHCGGPMLHKESRGLSQVTHL